MRHWFHTKHERDCGNFATGTDQLLALFTDSDARGPRSWRETFGYESAPRASVLKSVAISVFAMPKSSSDC